MPEAVIVAAARSPIGRAFKGSLATHPTRRPDRPAGAGRAGPGARSSTRPTIDDLMLGCGLPGGEQGFNMARVVAVLLGYDTLPGTTITRYCSSSLQTTRMALHAIRAGEGDVFISAGVETVSRFAKGNSDSLPDTRNPVFADAGRPHRSTSPSRAPTRLDRPARGRAACPTSTSRWARPRRTWRWLKGVTREDMDHFGVRSQNLAEKAIAERVLRPRDHAGHAARRHRGVAPTTARAPGSPTRASAGLKPVFRPDGRVTAGNCCPLNDGAAALVIMSDTKAAELGITPLARVVSTGRVRRCRRRSWAWARSRRPSRRWPAPA